MENIKICKKKNNMLNMFDFLSKSCNKQFDEEKKHIKRDKDVYVTSVSSARCRVGNGLASNDVS